MPRKPPAPVTITVPAPAPRGRLNLVDLKHLGFDFLKIAVVPVTAAILNYTHTLDMADPKNMLIAAAAAYGVQVLNKWLIQGLPSDPVMPQKS